MPTETAATKQFVKCEKCGKNLIVKLDDGVFHLRFGRVKDQEGNILQEGDGPKPALELLIHGSVKIRCISKDCDHWTTVHPALLQLVKDHN